MSMVGSRSAKDDRRVQRGRRRGYPAAQAAGGQGEDRKRKALTQDRSSISESITDALVVKDGEPFLICQRDGQVPVEGPHGLGMYHHDCRFLSGYRLRVAGHQLVPLGASEAAGATLVLFLTNGSNDGDEALKPEQLGVRWSRTIRASPPGLDDRIELSNYGDGDVDVPIEVRFRAEFEDVYIIRGLAREQPGELRPPTWNQDELRFAYRGGDGIDRSTRIRLGADPERRLPDGADLRAGVPTHGTTQLDIHVDLVESTLPDATPIEQRDSPKRQWRRNADRAHPGRDPEATSETWVGGHGSGMAVRTSSLSLRKVLARSLDDLSELRGRLDGLRYYEAGLPWFGTLFGRDAVVAALQSLPYNPDMAADTLRLLARRQGTEYDSWTEEQPGRILHELRIGELARLNMVPQTPYYGTVDATPLFLILLTRHAAWTGSLELFNQLRGNVDAALHWLATDADTDGDGFVDYRGDGGDAGLVNQGWKDSGNAIVMANGELAEPPIALAEVQGYVWLAYRELATLFDHAGDPDRASALRSQAEALRGRFESAFWMEDLGCYAMALGHGKPCAVVSSNAGQVLWSGIASHPRARRVAERLMAEDMFSGWGVRTLSAQARAYHPIGYHLGTVWPHDNSLIASGFRRYGFAADAERIFLGQLDAASHFPEDRLPECFAGFDREGLGVPIRYPVACHPQAWAAGAIPELLTAALGLEPDGFGGRLRVRRPRLPATVGEVELRDIPIGGGSADIRFTGAGDETRAEVLDASGVRVDVADAEPTP